MSIFKSITPATNIDTCQSENISNIIKNSLELDKQIDR